MRASVAAALLARGASAKKAEPTSQKRQEPAVVAPEPVLAPPDPQPEPEPLEALPEPVQEPEQRDMLEPLLEAPEEPAGEPDAITVNNVHNDPIPTPFERARALMAIARAKAREPRPALEPPAKKKPQRTPLEEVAARAEAALEALEGMVLIEEARLPIGQRRVYRKAAFALQRAQEFLVRIRALAEARKGK